MTPFSSTFVSLKSAQISPFFLSPLLSILLSFEFSLERFFCVAIALFDHLSINSPQNLRWILSLPIFEGIHVERVPENFRALSLSSLFFPAQSHSSLFSFQLQRPSLWYRASVRDNRAFCSRNASISLFERSVLLFSRSLSFFRFARSFFNASLIEARVSRSVAIFAGIFFGSFAEA